MKAIIAFHFAFKTREEECGYCRGNKRESMEYFLEKGGICFFLNECPNVVNMFLAEIVKPPPFN